MSSHTNDTYSNGTVSSGTVTNGKASNGDVSSGKAAKPANDLLQLADNVVKQTQAVAEYLQTHNHAKPTFAPDSIGRPETPEYVQLLSRLRQTMENLQYLVEGPKRHFRELCCQGYEIAALQVAIEFNFFTIVPSEGRISLEELAKKAGVDLDRTSRVIRLLTTEFIFSEPTPGYVSHNPSSYLLHMDDEIRSTVGYTYVTLRRSLLSRANNAVADSMRCFRRLHPRPKT